jgi:hypothetical protein
LLARTQDEEQKAHLHLKQATMTGTRSRGGLTASQMQIQEQIGRKKRRSEVDKNKSEDELFVSDCVIVHRRVGKKDEWC